jgi:SEC-C motif-containing protein
MRSRYAAYALDLSDYIIETTHPNNPNFQTNTEAWREDLHKFSQLTQFDSLTVNEFIDGTDEAFVTFTAYLRQAGNDNTFKERSRFEKLDGRWKYIEGEILEESL